MLSFEQTIFECVQLNVFQSKKWYGQCLSKIKSLHYNSFSFFPRVFHSLHLAALLSCHTCNREWQDKIIIRAWEIKCIRIWITRYENSVRREKFKRLYVFMVFIKEAPTAADMIIRYFFLPAYEYFSWEEALSSTSTRDQLSHSFRWIL